MRADSKLALQAAKFRGPGRWLVYGPIFEDVPTSLRFDVARTLTVLVPLL